MKELQAIQSELKAPKGQYNSFGKYSYRSCEDILEAVKPLLTKYECTLTISDDIVYYNNRYYVKATATIRMGSDSISTSAYAREPEQKKGMDESQITGAASSYARKYALNGLFCIDDTQDSDSHDNRDIKPVKNEWLERFKQESEKYELTQKITEYINGLSPATYTKELYLRDMENLKGFPVSARGNNG